MVLQQNEILHDTDTHVAPGSDDASSQKPRRSEYFLWSLVVALHIIVLPNPMGHSFRRATAWTMRQIPIAATMEASKLGHRVFGWFDVSEPKTEFTCGCSQMNN
jgi:hypothetical protein